MAKNITDLPNEMLLQIFSYCYVEDLVLGVQHVNSHWYELVRDAEMWKYLSYFPRRYVPAKEIIQVLQNAPLLKSLILLENVDESLVDIICTYCPNLQRLEFYDTQTVTTTMLEKILHCLPNLQNLTLRSMDIDSQNFSVVLGQFNNLKKLSLLHTFYTGSDILKCIADGCASLEFLRLDGIDVTDTNVRYFISKKGPQLSGLLLDGFRLSAGALTDIKLCVNLQKFLFHDCSALSEHTFSEIVRLPKLKSLVLISPQNISSKVLADSLGQALSHQLVELDLTKSQLDDQGVRNISENCQNLKCITLAMCVKISDESMRYISKCQKLQYLNIKSCALTDEAMSFLPLLRHLMYLNVSRNSVTDIGMGHVLKCTQLKILQINYCRVSGAMIEKLSSTLKLLLRFSCVGCVDSENKSNKIGDEFWTGPLGIV